MVQKRCENVDIEEFSNKNPSKSYIVLQHLFRWLLWSILEILRCKKRCEMVQKGVKTLIQRNFQMKTHANLIQFCSTYSGGCYGPDWEFGGVKKRCEMIQKRCENVDKEEFLNENPCKSYIVLGHLFRCLLWFRLKIWRCEKGVKWFQKGVKY